MTMLSVQFARTLQRGRAEPAPPPTRAGLLLTLLKKRAVAHNIGAEDLEAMLRDQIRWALPMRRGIDAESTD
jgi:hypothetical protein